MGVQTYLLEKFSVTHGVLPRALGRLHAGKLRDVPTRNEHNLACAEPILSHLFSELSVCSGE